MTTEKVKKLVAEYRNDVLRWADVLGISEKDGIPKQLSDEMRRATDLKPSERLSHYLFMCDQIVTFVESGKADQQEKAMRWLGFLQGVMWREGFYALSEMKQHSRS